MTDSESADGPPPFEDPFDADDVEQRIYGAVLQTREPATAGAIADRVGCDPKTARKYLGWFGDLGIVAVHDGQPTTFERNDEYFEWRRVDRLATEHSIDALSERVGELTRRIDDYRAAYGAEAPADVDAVAAADDRSVDDVYADLADWQTARRERDRYERARRRLAAEGERATG